ncbi:tRNA (guanine-N(1)-)-methyltransferase [candidate division SR1 bacterium Aalborg_AAW-1]|nr:tRNA (guanine-N(1)-)-methyltransferase [candidate division SR1 bacterium Aalborg_AAW-1]
MNLNGMIVLRILGVIYFLFGYIVHITYLSIFPELFDSFRETTLISRAVDKNLLTFETINPRHFCDDKHRVVDDEIYGGGHGLLMKAPPIIAAIKHWIEKNGLVENGTLKVESGKRNKKTHHPIPGTLNFKIIIPHPSQDVFNQSFAHNWSECSHLLFICGRYEGIDERVRLRLKKNYPDHTQRISLGQFVTLGGELPAMTMTEAVVRLLPGVINTELSWIEESYSLEQNMQNLEHPQYTRPEVVEGMKVPEVLLSGHHKKIAEWKKDNSLNLPPDFFFNRRGDREIE